MEYIIIFAVIGAIVGIVVFVSKKNSSECNEMVSNLTDEQKNFLMSTDVNFISNNEWVQNAIVAKVTDKGSKVGLRVLWYNKTIQNAEYNTITIADVNISKDEQQSHNLKVGDSVKISIAPEKTVGSVTIVWNQ